MPSARAPVASVPKALDRLSPLHFPQLFQPRTTRRDSFAANVVKLCPSSGRRLVAVFPFAMRSVLPATVASRPHLKGACPRANRFECSQSTGRQPGPSRSSLQSSQLTNLQSPQLKNKARTGSRANRLQWGRSILRRCSSIHPPRQSGDTFRWTTEISTSRLRRKRLIRQMQSLPGQNGYGETYILVAGASTCMRSGLLRTRD